MTEPKPEPWSDSMSPALHIWLFTQWTQCITLHRFAHLFVNSTTCCILHSDECGPKPRNREDQDRKEKMKEEKNRIAQIGRNVTNQTLKQVPGMIKAGMLQQ